VAAVVTRARPLELGLARPCPKCGQAGYLSQNGKPPKRADRASIRAELRRAQAFPPDVRIPRAEPDPVDGDSQRFYRCPDCDGRGFLEDPPG
jgi:hypothetical protein